MKPRKTRYGIMSALAMLASVILANWLTTRFGFVPVGFGLQSTAGTFAAGAALIFRDSTQDLLGKAGMLAVVAAGALVSYAVADPHIASASAAAFLTAELCEFAVYTPLRNRSRVGDKRWALAVTASSPVGSVIDTAVFLGIAFGPAAILPAMLGQLVGKAWATLAYLLVGKAISGSVLRQSDKLTAGA